MTSNDSGRNGQIAQDLVDALYYALGTDGARAMYAHGAMLRGRFVPAPGARALSSARIFLHPSADVLARFSDLVCIPGRAAAACHRGLAMKLSVPHEPELDLVAHSYDGFPCSTAEQFRQLLVAVGMSRGSEAEHTPLDRFLAAHPTAAAFFESPPDTCSGRTGSTYFGVNAFRFENTRGDRCHVRYRFEPRTHDRGAVADRCQSIADDLAAAMTRGPIVYEWLAQIAEPGDPLDDPSRTWPASRRLESLGSITLDQSIADPQTMDRKTLFLPANLPEGIASADPMLAIRDAAYPLSYRRRQ